MNLIFGPNAGIHRPQQHCLKVGLNSEEITEEFKCAKVKVGDEPDNI